MSGQMKNWSRESQGKSGNLEIGILYPEFLVVIFAKFF